MGRYKIYATVVDLMMSNQQDVLVRDVEDEHPECLLPILCRDIKEYGFLLGGQVGRKIWVDPEHILALWCDPIVKETVQ